MRISSNIKRGEGFDVFTACKLAGLKISYAQNEIHIKPDINLIDKTKVGLLLWFTAGVLIGTFSVIYADSVIEITTGTCLGFGVAVFSALALSKQASDYLVVNHENIVFRNSLRKRRIPLSKDLKVRMHTTVEYVKLKSMAGSGSEFRLVELYICHNINEFRILDFQMEEKFASKANALGNEISRLISERISRH